MRERGERRLEAIERSDSRDVSAQDQAPINLHERKGIVGETQSEDVQDRERSSATLHVSPHLTVRCDCLAFPENTDSII